MDSANRATASAQSLSARKNRTPAAGRIAKAFAGLLAAFTIGSAGVAHAAPNLLIDKFVSNPTPAAGETITYVIRYRCASVTEHCLNAEIEDPISGDLEVLSWSQAGGNVADAEFTSFNNTVTWELASGSVPGQLDAGASGSLRIKARFPACGVQSPAAGATVSNVATFTADGAAPTSSGASAADVTAPVIAACPPAPPAPTGDLEKRDGGAAAVSAGSNVVPWEIIFPASPAGGGYTLEDQFTPGMTLTVGDPIRYPAGSTVDLQCGGVWYTDAIINSGGTAAPPFYLTSQLQNGAETNCTVSTPLFATTSGLEFTNLTAIRVHVPASVTSTSYWWNFKLDSSYAGATLSNEVCVTETGVDIDGNGGTADTFCDGAQKTVVPALPIVQGGKYSVVKPGYIDNISGASILDANGDVPATITPAGYITSRGFEPLDTTGLTILETDAVFAINGYIDRFTAQGADWVDPVLYDILPAGMSFDTGPGGSFVQIAMRDNPLISAPYDPFDQPACRNPSITVTQIVQGGENRDRVEIAFPGCTLYGGLPDSGRVTMYISGRLDPGAPAGAYSNDLNSCSLYSNIYDSGNSTSPSSQNCKFNGASFNVSVLPSVDSSKYVKGALDSTPHRFPNTGFTDLTGTGTYELYIENTGNVNYEIIDVVDVLPWIGDSEITSAAPRGSQWSEELSAAITIERYDPGTGTWSAVPATDISSGPHYSTSQNPCRLNGSNEITITEASATLPAGCDASPWTGGTSTVADGAISFGLRLQPATALAPGEQFRIVVPVEQLTGEADAASGAIAWNSFAFSATYPDPDLGGAPSTLLATEPLKVGIEMIDVKITAALGDYVWLDSDGDGQQDSGETPIVGVTVNLYEADGTTFVASTTTNVNGEYMFYGLDPNTTYVVRLDNPADHALLAPLNGLIPTTQNSGADASDSDSEIDPGDGYPEINGATTGNPETETRTYDFGFINPAKVGNRVWADVNGDGFQDAGESGIAGVTVRLLDSLGGVVTTAVTDSSGNYLFDNLVPGIYSLEFVAPAGLVFTISGATGNTETDSNPNGAGLTSQFVLSGGDCDLSFDAGLVAPPADPAAKEGRVWEDLNLDGIEDPLEPPVPGILVTLLDASGLPIATTTTDAFGEYSFANLSPGVNCSIQFSLNPGQIFTTQDTGGNVLGGADDSDPDTTTGETGTYTTIANTTIPDIDAGIISKLSLGNLVWYDVNNNGVVDSGEGGIPGVTVRLLDNGGATIGTTTTDANGRYLFQNLDAGNYSVQIDLPTGYQSSTDIGTSPTPNAADSDDNGVTVAVGTVTSNQITLAVGGSSLGEPSIGESDHGVPINGALDYTPDVKGYYTVDFGLYLTVSIGSTVFTDTNDDGIFDHAGTETGIDGVRVELFMQGEDPTIATPTASMNTAGGGHYFFDDLLPGTYFVYIPTPPASAPLSSTTTTISDNDTDDDDNGTQASSGDPVQSPDIVLAPNTESTSETATEGGSADDSDDDNGNMTVDFGFVPAVSLGSTVFFDIDDDGEFEPADGEDGISNVLVELYNAGDTAGVSPTVDTDTTDADGHYFFGGLLPGSYFVHIPTAPSAAPTSSAAGVTDTNDNSQDDDDNGTQATSGAATTSPDILLSVDGETLVETGTEGGNQDSGDDNNGDMTVDFGFVPNMSIGSTVFLDTDSDGEFDHGAGEDGIGGVGVELYLSTQTPGTDTPIQTDTTDVNGHYYFGNLIPGSYVVYIPTPPATAPTSSPSGVTDTNDNSQDDDDNGSQTVSGGPVTSPVIALAAGTETAVETATEGGNQDSAADSNGDMTVDFGFVSNVSIGSTVFYDLDDDGQFEFADGETGISGVLVELYNSTDTPGVSPTVATDTTDASGHYYFGSLAPGSYIVYIPTAPANAPLSSTTTVALDNGTDNDDNGIQASLGAATTSPVIALAATGEPTAGTEDITQGGNQDSSADGAGDMTVDFGFVPTGSIGSTVFLDLDDDGQFETVDGEDGIAGVLVELYLSTQNPVTDTPIQTDTTSADGHYFFDKLLPNSYVVYIPTPPASAGRSSSAGVTDTVDNGQDDDDNGIQTTAGGPVSSPVIVLTVDGESITEVAAEGGNQDSLDDNNGDMTVDFGFVPSVSLGSTVFLDEDNDGQYETVDGEDGIPGVLVELYNSTDTPGVSATVATDTTDPDGHYYFSGLTPGSYIVYIPTPPATAPTSSAAGVTDTLDNSQDNDDNGIQAAPGNPVSSPVITLTADGESTGEDITEGGNQDAADNNNGDMTVDFGFVPYVSLGSTVFYDLDDDGAYETADGEDGISGVDVELYYSTDTPGVSPTVATDTTDGDGHYYFGNLLPNDYIVYIPTPPIAAPDSSSAGVTDTADNGQDDDDNGSQTTSGGAVTSPTISLDHDDESTSETATEGGNQDSADDNNGDMTVDFGFVPSGSIGSTVFLDLDDDGQYETVDGEDGIGGVDVELYLSTQTPGTDTPIQTDTTDGDGHYYFDKLLPGSYIVYIPTPPASAGRSSAAAVTDTVDNGQDDDDNGSQATPGGPVTSPIITLTANGESTSETLTEGGNQDSGDDNNGDMTVDFGFVPSVSLGSTVFYDHDDDGQFETADGEDGIGGVLVELFLSTQNPATDVPVQTDTTDVDGHYYFSGLTPGDYVVYIPTPPTGATTSSAAGVTDTNDNADDNDDNGIQAAAGNPVTSPVITLSADGESITEDATEGGNQDSGDDNNGNMTVDFGFVPRHMIGSTVFSDDDDDGLFEPGAGEDGIGGVTVQLYNTGDTPGVSPVVASDVTDADGHYLFDNLLAGSYFVYIPTPPATHKNSSASGVTDTNDNGQDDDDNGIQSTSNGPVTSPDIVLAPDSEATGETATEGGSQDAADDNNGDMTVDFGFVPDEYDLALIKTAGAWDTGVPALGSKITFTIKVQNQGNMPADAYTVVDTLPAGLTYDTASSDIVTPVNAGQDITWTIDPALDATDQLAAGGVHTFTVTAELTTMLSDYLNVAEITFDSGDDDDSTPNNGAGPVADGGPDSLDDNEPWNDMDPGDQDDSDYVSVSATPEYDLALIKTVGTWDTGTPALGSKVTFTIKVQNQGNMPADAYTVVDTLPAGLTYDTASSDIVTPVNAGQDITWTIDPALDATDQLAPGGVHTFTVTAELTTMLSTYTNVAEVTFDSGNDDDSTPNNGAGPVADGGPDSLDDDEPWNDMDPGDQDDSDYAVITASPEYDLALIKTAGSFSATPALVGSTITFTIKVQNQGNMPADAYTVVDTLPAGLTYVGASNDIVTPVNAGQNITWTVDPAVDAADQLAPNAVHTFTVTAQVSALMSEYINIAEITVDSGADDDSTPNDGAGPPSIGGPDGIDDDEPWNDKDAGDEDDSDYAVVGSGIVYDLALIKRLGFGQPAWIVANDLVNFDILVKNQGNVPSGTFTVVDTVPAGMSWISGGNANIVCTHDGSVTGGLATCVYTPPVAATDLAPGGVETIPVQLRVDDLSQAPFVNWAEITVDSSATYAVMDADSVPNDHGANDNGPGEGTAGGDTVIDHDDIDHTATGADEDDSDPATVYTASSTPITLKSFHASGAPDSGQVDFAWTTSMEDANVGFYLYGRVPNGPWERINADIIATTSENDSETAYQYQATGTDAMEFAITDVDVFGEETVHGPFELNRPYGFDATGDAAEDDSLYEREYRDVPVNPTQNSVYLAVTASGVQRVTYEALKQAGYNWANLATSELAITYRGEPQEIRVAGRVTASVFNNTLFGPGGYVEFVAEAEENLMGQPTIYKLELNESNARRVAIDPAPVSSDTPAPWFFDTALWEEDRQYSRVAPSADPWYARKLLSVNAPVSTAAAMTLNSVVPTQDAEIRVNVWSSTNDVNVDGEHHVTVRVNGAIVHDERIEGMQEKALTATVPAGLLQTGQNIVNIEVQNDNGAQLAMVMLDSIEIDYPRYHVASQNRLNIESAATAMSVSNLTNDDIVVYRRDADGVVRLQTEIQQLGDNWTVSFSGTGNAATYLVAEADSGTHRPQIRPVPRLGNLKSGRATYLVIAHRSLMRGSIRRLMQARQAKGLRTKLVDVDWIYGAYADGNVSTDAIRDYIAYARQRLGTRYVVLVGGDTYDYKNQLRRRGRSLIPTLYAPVGNAIAHAPVDALYGDINGDGVPEVSVGRFPVQNEAELRAMVDKTLTYEQTRFGRKTLFAADSIDDATSANFSSYSNQMIRTMGPGWRTTRTYLDQLPEAVARRRAVAAINNGSALTSWMGHSDLTTWGFDQLLRRSDVRQLRNSAKPTVVMQYGCWNTYYVDPNRASMAFDWLLLPNRGAAAVMGASTLTQASSEKLLGDRLTYYLTKRRMTLGDALVWAKRDLVRSHPIESVRDVVYGYTILGDPAMRIQQR